MDKIKKIFLEIKFYFFYFLENYSRRVRKSTNKKKILALLNKLEPIDKMQGSASAGANHLIIFK